MAPTIKTLSRALAPVSTASPAPLDLGTISEAEIEQALAYAENEKAPASRRGYAIDWRQFEKHASAGGADPCPKLPVHG
jgi:hypothetical protein